MKSFAEHYPLPLFEALQEHAGRYPHQEGGKYDPNLPALNEWTDGLKSHEQAIDAAIIAFLMELRDSRFLSEVQPMYKRTHRLAHAWNAFVKGTCSCDQMDRIRDCVSKTLFRYSLVTVHKDLQASYKALVERADSGDLPWYFTESQEECQTTGERLHVEWYEWLPRLGTRPEKAFRDCLIPAREIGPGSVSHHEIQAPSGELLLADWFRIPGFNEAVEDPAAKAYDYNINNDLGKVRQSKWYASQHGFASVFVGNSSPQVLVRELGKGSGPAGRAGHFLLAHVDEDNRLGQPPAIGRFAGRVCTDLWWATIIDREVLTRIIARTVPRGEAEAMVADYIAEHDIATVKVRPGTAHVYHTAAYHEMSDFFSPDVPANSIESTFAVVSERELKFARKDEVKAETEAAKGKRRPKH